MCSASSNRMNLHVLLSSIFYFSAVLGLYVDIKPKYIVVKEGDPVTILCKTNGVLDYCRIEMPGEGKLSLSSNKPPYNGITYHGQGLLRGECGMTIPRALQKHNGEIRCAFTSTSESMESSANMTLVVAKAPTRPSLSVSKSSRSNNVYKEGETLVAVCTVQNGRPAANISWYLGDTKIYDGISVGEAVKGPDELFSVEQKMTRTLQASDNGKLLKCQAEHPLLLDKDSSTSQPIQVHFAPKANEPIEQFGLVEGEDGRVAVVIMAHPRPTFTWNIGGLPVYENDENDRFKVERAVELPPGSGNWESVLVIKSLTKEDVEKDYTLTASNIQGEKKFIVNLSTSPEPKGVDLGAGTIIAIVAGALLVITITAMLLFARAKGRWCFAGTPESRIGGESSDTESAEHHAEGKSKLPFTAVFKKKGDKVSGEQNKPKDVTVTDEKANTEGATEEEQVKIVDEREGVVYAELDLQNSPPPRGGITVRPDDDKTEYAEIIHSKDAK